MICNCTIPDCQLRRRGDEISTLLPKIYCPITQKLLHGPWTDDKIKFLNGLLRMSTISVDWTDKDAVRIAVKGKREAILQRNLDAVHLFSRVRRLGKAPNIELVKFAVMEAGCDRSVVFDLIVAAMDWGHRRWNDVELDQWVVKKEREGDLKGRWLRVKLEELRRGKHPDRDMGDYVGVKDVLELRDAPFRVSLLEESFLI